MTTSENKEVDPHLCALEQVSKTQTQAAFFFFNL